MFFKVMITLFLLLFSTFGENIANNRKSNYLSQSNSKLLIILVDGFRWDYVSRDKSLKGFPLIEKNGVHAEYVKPIFPANSYPNWYAISTGLYAESHGIINNYMYDKDRNEFFLMGPDANASHSHWWNQTEPLWINAEKQGLKTSMYFWDGCQVTFNGIKASFCYLNIGYFPVPGFIANIITRRNYKQILNDFAQNKYSLSFLYNEIVDKKGHDYGTTSDNLITAVKQIDSILYDLYNDLIKRKLNESVNVVIVSDHGMTDLKAFKEISLSQSIDFNDIQLMLGWGTGSQIAPIPDKEDKVYNQLLKIEGIKVYKKNNIPDNFHFKNNGLVLPILVLPRLGYYISPVKRKSNVMPVPGFEWTVRQGDHGYDEGDHFSDMWGIMYGFGPAFKKNFVSKPLEMVDHYNIFCKILGITPHPNNGSMNRINQLFNY